MKWVNFGGGNHITRAGLRISGFWSAASGGFPKVRRSGVPGAGRGCGARRGFLVSTVLGYRFNGMKIAILVASAACHMPDVLEMPYRPGSWSRGCRVKRRTPSAGRTDLPCRRRDGDYSFDGELSPATGWFSATWRSTPLSRNNTFNGMGLPRRLRRGEGRDTRCW
jgi:carboxynorspermidine decarboxylase